MVKTGGANRAKTVAPSVNSARRVVEGSVMKIVNIYEVKNLIFYEQVANSEAEFEFFPLARQAPLSFLEFSQRGYEPARKKSEHTMVWSKDFSIVSTVSRSVRATFATAV